MPDCAAVDVRDLQTGAIIFSFQTPRTGFSLCAGNRGGLRIVYKNERVNSVRVCDGITGSTLHTIPVDFEDGDHADRPHSFAFSAFSEGGLWSSELAATPALIGVTRCLQASIHANYCCVELPRLPAELWEHVFGFVAVPSRLAGTGRRLSIYEFY
jgi:hypothetical protein